jgi:hypothetical protein
LKESQAKGGGIVSKKICTHCGENKGTTLDHVFATCLFVEPSDERSIKVPSCRDCNCKSNEGLLKSFFSLFDNRLAQTRLGEELLHPQGKGDLRSFLRICTPDVRVAYPEEQVTRLLKKLFQGLRRHLLKHEWTFLSADDLTVFTIGKDGGHQFVRPLPLRISGPNQPFQVPPAFEMSSDLGHCFREFRIDLIDVDVIRLNYSRTNLGNELALLALSAPQKE